MTIETLFGPEEIKPSKSKDIQYQADQLPFATYCYQMT
jgi:hypothetical protein